MKQKEWLPLDYTNNLALHDRVFEIYIIRHPFFNASFVMNNQLRFQGKAFYGMFGIGTDVVLNMVLDPIFIFIFGLGIQGAALSTVISQIISFTMLLILYYYHSNVKFKLVNSS